MTRPERPATAYHDCLVDLHAAGVEPEQVELHRPEPGDILAIRIPDSPDAGHERLSALVSSLRGRVPDDVAVLFLLGGAVRVFRPDGETEQWPPSGQSLGGTGEA